MENNQTVFNKNSLLVIDEFGSIYKVPDKKDDFYHWEVFQRLDNEVIPNILEGYLKDMEASCGLDLSSFIAAKGYTVFWPYAIGDPSIMIITTPRIPTNSQTKQIKKYLNYLTSDNISFTTSEYETPSLISCITIFDSVDLPTANKEINNYLDITTKLNGYSDTFLVDTKGPLVKK